MTKKYWVLSTGLLLIIAFMIGINIIPAVAADDEEDAEPNRCEQYLAKVADNLGTDVETLSSALVDAKLEMVDEAVEDGKLTEDQADKIKAKIEENGACPDFHERMHRPLKPPMGARMLDRAVEEGIITQDQADEVTAIFEQIKAYIKENGCPEIGPQDGEMLDRAVEEGIITQEQADTITEVMEAIKDHIKENGPGAGMKGEGSHNGEFKMGPRGGGHSFQSFGGLGQVQMNGFGA